MSLLLLLLACKGEPHGPGDDSAGTTDSAPSVDDSSGVDDSDAPDPCEGARELEGDLAVEDASGLAQVEQVRRVGGSLTLSGELGSLAALSCLQEVGGSFDLESTDLVDLSGLERLERVEGTLGLRLNEQLTSLELPALHEAGAVGIYRHRKLETVALDALETTPSFVVAVNDVLVSASAASLPESREIVVQQNPQQTTLSLPALQAAPYLELRQLALTELPFMAGIDESTIVLDDNDALVDLSGLAELRRINGELSLTGNDALLELDPLHGLETINGDLTLSGNGLDIAEAEALVAAIGEITGTVTIDE